MRSLLERLGIIPGRILDFLAVDADVVVAGVALPRAVRVGFRVREGQLVLLHGVRWEVDVPLDGLVRVRRGDHGGADFGGCGWHGCWDGQGCWVGFCGGVGVWKERALRRWTWMTFLGGTTRILYPSKALAGVVLTVDIRMMTSGVLPPPGTRA